MATVISAGLIFPVLNFTPRATSLDRGSSEADFSAIVRLVASLFPEPHMPEDRKREILRLFLKRHRELFDSDEAASIILETTYFLLRTIRN